jgi:hypothetical protein
LAVLIQRHSVLALGAAHLRSLLSKEPNMTQKPLFAGALLASLLGTAGAACAQVQAKWFVLRNHEVGNCWIATLVRLDSQYTSTFERKAGGPYDTEEQALARLKSLSDQGTCNRD